MRGGEVLSINVSPLRYPGGKAKLYPYIREILEINNLLGETYIEPFAGGAGLALRLLLNGDVKRIIINDLDPAIYYFWYCVLNHTNDLCKLILDTPITPEEWHKQKAIYVAGFNNNPLEFAFATFFLNRTNVSGVLTGGIIGGSDQSGKYKIDARFNRQALTSRIQEIAKHKDQIILTDLDAKLFLHPNNLRHYYKSFINLDPPYVKKGHQLYKNAFSLDDHRELFDIVSSCKRKWIVTYDVCEFVDTLYKQYRSSYLDINYSVRGNRKAKEYIFFSDNLIIPKDTIFRATPHK